LSKTARLLDLDMSKDEALLIEVLDNMDEMIFSDYVKRRLVLLVEVIQGGILNSGVDWLNTPKPTGESELKHLKGTV
jgi:exocyst complex component 2